MLGESREVRFGNEKMGKFEKEREPFKPVLVVILYMPIQIFFLQSPK